MSAFTAKRAQLENRRTPCNKFTFLLVSSKMKCFVVFRKRIVTQSLGKSREQVSLTFKLTFKL